MIQKLTRMTTRVLATLIAVFATSSAWADFAKTNPVTGETENYTWKFVGTDTWNGTQYWQNSDSAAPAGVPAKSGDSSWGGSDDQWLPILFDGNTIQINAGMSVEGWNLRMGLYNGANITLQHLVKLQSGVETWFTVDENSTLTIAGMDNNKLEGSNPLCLYSARANGITWTPALSNSAIGDGVQMPIYYYLAGDGTVAFNGGITLASAQVIKRADVTLSEATSSKTVRSKTLVSFASTSTSTFSADAETTIKVKNSDGTALKDVNLTSVTATDTTLTTAGNVGDCELVQTSTGILLYYVDYAKTYKPSININFTNGAGNGLTTSADVGLDGYAVPGTSWNNFVVANNTTFNTVNAIDSTGAASVASGVSVSISGTRGHWNCSNLTPASNPLHGYIDESADGPTPTVTITGIPYEHYRVIVYHSTDQNGAKFGYDTINGFNFTYVDGVQTEGTTSWGSAGASNSAEPIGEGTNTLVSAVLSGDTVTMVAHRIGGGSPTARGCFAAIQVVEYVPEVSENDLEIAVDGATEYGVTETKNLSGTVYLTGAGTLTLTGSEKITAATIDVAKDVVLNINADRLDATTFTGAGTVVYDTTAPVEGKGWANIGWSGTVWIKNQEVSAFEGTKFGNAASTVRFTGVTGYLQTSSWNSSTYVHTVPLELVDEGNTIAFTYNDGWGGNLVKINTLKGTGTLKTQGSGAGEHIYIVDASGFTGVFNLTAKSVYVGGNAPAYSDATSQSGKLEIRSGVTMTVPSSKTWTANSGFVVNGTLNVNGTLASDSTTAAVSGSGTVVFTSRLPTPVDGSNETKWWKNANWTGTVQIDSLTGFIGSGNGTVLAPNDYGNTGSTLELKNCSGWLPVNYECTVPLSVAGTLTIGNGHSGVGNAFTIDHLKGSGQITCNSSAPTVLIYVREWSGYTGKVKMDNKMIVFGADTITASDLVSGTIYICEGAVVTNRNASHWEPAANMKVNGTFAVTARSGWSDGKGAVLGENGIINFIGSGVDDHAYNFSNITGSGKILFSNGTGYSMLPSEASKMPSTDVAVVNDNTASFVVLTCTGTTTIGTLSGSGKFDSRYGNATTRRLAVVQGADSEWSGTFVNDDRVGGMYVSAKSGAAAKTLTLSGTQTASNELVVQAATETTDAGSVNLTGTWQGDTTVSGTFGGTGTLTGNLTFSDGATFKAFATDDNGLSVSGTVTCPEEGTVTVDASALEDPGTYALLTASGLDAAKFALAEGAPEGATLAVVEGVLTLTVPTPSVTITIPTVANATVAVTVDGVPVTPENGVVTAQVGATVVVTYTAVDGYTLTGGTIEFTAAADTTTVDTTDVTVTEYIAWIYDENDNLVGNPYTTVFEAVQTFLTTTTGESIRFKTSIEESDAYFHTMLLNACDYNDETFTYTRKPSVAKVTSGIQEYLYTSLVDAVNDTISGDTVTLLAEVTLTDRLVVSNKTLTLDLNGYAITASGIDAITSSGALTIQGSSGSISVTSGNSVVLTDSAATLTVTGVTLSPEPTTNVSRHRVVSSADAGTTTYTVEVIPGTIFMVY